MPKYLVGILLLFFTLSLSSQETAKDTINQKDAENRKQGYWVISGQMRKDTSFSANSTIEKGRYENGRKIGVWTRYYPNGNIQSKITYANGRPKGSYE